MHYFRLEITTTSKAKNRLNQQASTDEQLIKMWLHSKASSTQKAYAREAEIFLQFVSKSLQAITIADIQDYVDEQHGLAPATVARSLNAIKSLCSFGQRIGYLPFNVAAPERAPRIKNTTAERILTREEVESMIASAPTGRDLTILLVLYTAAPRVSELCKLKWRDVRPAGVSGQITIFGKGGKTRTVLVPVATWTALKLLKKPDALPDDPVFLSQKGGHISTSQVWRIVKVAASRVGITQEVSPHWLRHCNASHSLDAHAPLHLVQQTLGHSSAATTSKYLHARPNDSSGMYLGM